MADHAVLKAQNDAAYERGHSYLAHADGWTVLNEENGLRTSFLTHNGENVGRYEGSVNKSPEFVIKFMAGNLVKLRETHNPNNVSTEYVADFPDKSHVVKEVSRSPLFGDVTSYTFYSHRIAEDGSITLVGNTPNVEAYPRAVVWINFFILTVRPSATGSDYTLVVGVESTVEVTTELSHGLALQYKAFYGAVINEIVNSAA